MDVVESRGFSATRNTEIRWEDRSIKPALDWLLGAALLGFTVTFLLPFVALLASGLFLAFLLVFPWLRLRAVGLGSNPERWVQVPRADISLGIEERSVRCSGTGRNRYVSALEIEEVGPILPGSLAKLIRGIDTDFGFSLAVTMEPEAPNRVAEDGVLEDSLVKYLGFNSSEQRRAYFYIRGGVWKVGVRLTCGSYSQQPLMLFESQVKGSLPLRGIKPLKLDVLSRNLLEWHNASVRPVFLAAGIELSDWLVQLPSELAPEVGSNVPGEFLSPIRQGPMDYRLGVAINPETLKNGPPVGLVHSNLESGLLLCGGEWGHRFGVLLTLIRGLIDRGKRVILITQEEDALHLATMTDGGVGMALGRDLIINPVDSEGVRRSKYVAELLLTLESFAGTNLSAATDFEVALNRVVALGNGTVADVVLSESSEDIETAVPQTRINSRESRLAMDSIRRLHEGSGAQAFYGTQTASLKRITDLSLAVITAPFESPDLTMFAYDLLSLKISGLDPDPDLVVVLDSPANLMVSQSSFRYTKKGIVAVSQVKQLLRRGPLIVSIDSPSSLPAEGADSFGSCIALRLRETQDIAVASDLLSLSVVSGGIHSKKRVSSRESSFLRVMESNQALVSTSELKACVPVRLDPSPVLRDVEPEAIGRLESDKKPPDGRRRTLLDTVGGKDSDSLVRVLGLLQKYEPLTEQSVSQFLKARGDTGIDVEAILARLENASMILRGHETHGNVSYTNYRITMKGSMALKQVGEVSAR
jgi:hypothetical protein